MVKRSFVEFAAETEPNLTIITADGARIPAHVDVSEQKGKKPFRCALPQRRACAEALSMQQHLIAAAVRQLSVFVPAPAPATSTLH
jgi:hypothetical protein